MATDPDFYLAREHTNQRCSKPMIKIDEAYEMLKRGALRSEVVKLTGLSADQVHELRLKAKSR